MVVEIQRISSAPLTVVGPCITGRPRAVATLQGPHEMGDKRTPVDSMKVQNGVPFINMNRLYIYIYISTHCYMGFGHQPIFTLVHLDWFGKFLGM